MKRSFLGSELKVIPCNYYFFLRKQLQLFYLQFEQNKYFTTDWITKEKQKLKKKKKKKRISPSYNAKLRLKRYIRNIKNVDFKKLFFFKSSDCFAANACMITGSHRQPKRHITLCVRKTTENCYL